jgi:hypothetical protein
MRYVLLALTLVLIGAGITSSADKKPAEPVLLEKHHKIAGVTCADCHESESPVKSASAACCIECHEGYEKNAELTKETDPNPHEHHEGSLDCLNCHHVHKKSEDYCSKCHSWGYKVP